MAKKAASDDLVTLLMMRALRFPESSDYDMPGFTEAYLSGDPRATHAADPNDGGAVHFVDTWKRPNHPSFSDQSMYAEGPGFPKWEGAQTDEEIPSWVLRDRKGRAQFSDTPWLQGPSGENRVARGQLPFAQTLLDLLRGN